MAVAAETLNYTYEQTYSTTTVEEYGRSLRQLRTMGRFIVGNVVTAEAIGVQHEAYMDFNRAVGENLTTDKEFGEQLVFDPLESFKIVDGLVVDKAGKPISNMVRQGWFKSKKAAETNPEMSIEAERNEGDVITAHIVDNLEVGEMYSMVSVEPKDELKRNPDFWHKQMHYIDGMAVVQVYYRKSEAEMLAGYYSIKGSSLEALRAIYKGQGVDIPEGESANRWSRYGLRKRVEESQAALAGPNLVEQHRRLTGQKSQVYSVTELMTQNQVEVDRYFNAYILPLSEALESNTNNQTMQSLAESLLRNAHKLPAADRQHLMRVASSSKFNEADAIFMEEKVRYALVEELRTRLVKTISSGVKPAAARIPAISATLPFYAYSHPDPFSLSLLNERASRNVASGSDAGRSYGGCSGAGSGNNNEFGDNLNDLPGSQKVWGGYAEETVDSKEDDDEEDEFGSLSFRCRNGHKNRRKPTVEDPSGWVYKCKDCNVDTGCGKEPPVTKAKKTENVVLPFAKKSKKENKKWAA